MLKPKSREGRIGTPVRCPVCRYPNLGIDIWCQRCGTPLDWKGHRAKTDGDRSRPRRSRGMGNAPWDFERAARRLVPARWRQRALRRRRSPSIPRLALPALSLPRLALPALRRPQLSLPRIPRIAWVVGLVLAVLLIAPLAYVLLPGGRELAARSTPLARPAATTAATPNPGTPQAAAIPGVEAKTGLRYTAGKCAANAPCLTLAGQTVGQEAAAIVFSTASSGGRECAGYVYHAGGTWHFLNAVCGLPGQLSPLVGRNASVHVPGNCANVRTSARLSAARVACLNHGTVVHLDGGPSYADDRLWWHVANRGWIAHEFMAG